ncbi:polyhydroxyalkanoic acid system family protein [Haliea atlantica]|jgi:putative polyhydroxyalkanoate system protein|nr:polyhydroxyalkanoic acid synthase [Haliea sp.]
MAGFHLSKPYTMPRDELRAAAERLASRLEQQHGIKAQWQGDRVRMHGHGVEGELSFDGGVVDVSVKLGLLASAFQRPLKAEVQRYLDEMIS